MAGWAKGLAGWPRGGNGQTNGQTYGWKISPFYRTLSPIGAAALPPPMKTKEKEEQGKGTADHLMPLGYLLYIPPHLQALWVAFRPPRPSGCFPDSKADLPGPQAVLQSLKLASQAI